MENRDIERTGARSSGGRVFSLLPGFGDQVLFWSVGLAIFGFDLWSKKAVFSWLIEKPGHEYSIIDGFLKFVLAVNPGAAFGMASGKRVFLVAVAAIALILVVGVFLAGKVRSRLMIFALGLFGGGVAGNFYDRAFNDGLVRDFIDVYWGSHHWPAFNVADSALCVAVAIIVFLNFRAIDPKSDQKHVQQHTQEHSQ